MGYRGQTTSRCDISMAGAIDKLLILNSYGIISLDMRALLAIYRVIQTQCLLMTNATHIDTKLQGTQNELWTYKISKTKIKTGKEYPEH